MQHTDRILTQITPAEVPHDHSHDHNHEHGDHHHHGHSFKEELLHHLPYAIFSVALGMIVLSLLDYTSAAQTAAHSHAAHDHSACSVSGYHILFHSFHFLHILFAATGTVITFSRFSRSISKALLVGIISPAIFCMLSDVLLPYLAGRLLGVDMELHICFHRELHNVLPFLAIGVLNGMVLRSHHSSMLRVFSLGSHFVHILISSLASLFYMVSHGFENWYPQMGYVFLFLVVAIVIPCTFSDVIVPMYFAGVKKR
ncbi:hypothetical protein H0X48_03235 [Candidatus Dependentiae bacterium]|nr:hypothetical protein [Candidatus Dependentiae bacterium]